MKRLRTLNKYRDRAWERNLGCGGDDTGGCFKLPSPVDQFPLACMIGIGEGWEHISVSRNLRCPNWTEMEHVKRTFFNDNEVAMQLHVPPKDHISVHPYCLHIWRPLDVEIPLPPTWMVA